MPNEVSLFTLDELNVDKAACISAMEKRSCSWLVLPLLLLFGDASSVVVAIVRGWR